MMESKIIVRFKKINSLKVDEKLLKENPKLIEATRKTVTILCEQIKKYFAEHKIKTKVKFELIE